jgi:hypothetical protein
VKRKALARRGRMLRRAETKCKAPARAPRRSKTRVSSRPVLQTAFWRAATTLIFIRRSSRDAVSVTTELAIVFSKGCTGLRGDLYERRLADKYEWRGVTMQVILTSGWGGSLFRVTKRDAAAAPISRNYKSHLSRRQVHFAFGRKLGTLHR